MSLCNLTNHVIIGDEYEHNFRAYFFSIRLTLTELLTADVMYTISQITKVPDKCEVIWTDSAIFKTAKLR